MASKFVKSAWLTTLIFSTVISGRAMAENTPTFKFSQWVNNSVKVGYRTNPKVIYVSQLYIGVQSVFVEGQADGSMRIAFSTNDGIVLKSHSPWITIPKDQVQSMPKGLHDRLTKNQNLEPDQVLYLLNDYALRNMGERIRVGEDVFEAWRTQFVSSKTPSNEASPEGMLTFIARAVKDRDEAVISSVYGNLNTGATGRFSGFNINDLKKLEGKTLSFSAPKSVGVREKWTDYAVSADQTDRGFCSREEDLRSTMYQETGKPVLNAIIHCFSNKSHKDYADCESTIPYADQTCSVELELPEQSYNSQD